MLNEVLIKYSKLNHWKELSSEEQLLVEEAYKACDKAYAPYSKFKVGASLLMKDNSIVLGSNQENVAYPSGLCAERVALFNAGANFPDIEIRTLCIVAKGEFLPFEKVLAPCGGCRQVMVESENRQLKPYKVILVSQNGITLIFNSAKDLLPFAFDVN